MHPRKPGCPVTVESNTGNHPSQWSEPLPWANVLGVPNKLEKQPRPQGWQLLGKPWCCAELSQWTWGTRGPVRYPPGQPRECLCNPFSYLRQHSPQLQERLRPSPLNSLLKCTSLAASRIRWSQGESLLSGHRIPVFKE